MIENCKWVRISMIIEAPLPPDTDIENFKTMVQPEADKLKQEWTHMLTIKDAPASRILIKVEELEK